jgi:hypothetical protein
MALDRWDHGMVVEEERRMISKRTKDALAELQLPYGMI